LAAHLFARGIAFWIAASSKRWWNRHITFINAQKKIKHKKAAVLQWMPISRQLCGGFYS